MRPPADLPCLRTREKRALFKRNGAESLPRGEVKDGLLDRAFQAQTEGDDPDHQGDRRPVERRFTHTDQEHTWSVEIPPSVEREGRRHQYLLRGRQGEGEGKNPSEKRVRDLPSNRRRHRSPSPSRLLDAQSFVNQRWNDQPEGRSGEAAPAATGGGDDRAKVRLRGSLRLLNKKRAGGCGRILPPDDGCGYDQPEKAKHRN